MVISNNTYLSLEDMTVNADHILFNLLSKGWTKNAVCGMLGNMQTESTINPGLWQSLAEGNMNLGFGLVQWTPARKYTSWADGNAYAWGDIDGQLERLQHEIDNNLQWIKTTSYPMSFKDFKISKLSPEYLAQAFLRNYERPKNQKQPLRSTQARYWYDTLTGGSSGSLPFFPTVLGTPVTSKWGWRSDPFDGTLTFHDGTDFGGSSGDPIYATQSGVVIVNAFNGISGNYIRIEHSGDKYFSGYQHLNVRSPLPVGEFVAKGQQIGTMGTTGSSTGVHLHFQIAISATGWYSEDGTIDPELYLLMDDGGDGGIDPTPNDINSKAVALFLCDALNGWKF